MLFSSSPPPPLLRVNSLYTAKPPFTDSMVADAPRWAQKTITLLPHRRGCHLITPKCIKQAPLSLSMRITTLMFETTLRLSSTKLFPREDLPLEAYPRRSVVLYFTLNFKRNESSLSFWFLSSHSRDCKK
eukprot:XP_024456403.1 uncharacterized protein LOC18099719 isoform X3 [Populus trichocarpa]